MNKQQLAWFRRNNFLVDTCEKHRMTWESKPFFEEAYLQFVALHEQVRTLYTRQNQSAEGFTEEKREKRSLLENEIGQMSRALTAYALLKKEKALKDMVHRPVSLVERMSDMSLAGFASVLVQHATALLPQLLNWEVTEAKITALQAAATDFIKYTEIAKGALNARTSDTRSLQELFGKINQLLRHILDAQAVIFATGSTEFYRDYQSARNTRKPGRRRRALVLLVKDAATREPLQDVLVQIENAEIERMASSKGRTIVSRLPAGEIRIVCSKEGYVEKTEVVCIVKGETTKLAVELERV